MFYTNKLAANKSFLIVDKCIKYLMLFNVIFVFFLVKYYHCIILHFFNVDHSWGNHLL